MTRKEMIIIAVLTNISVLAILFMLAFHGVKEQPVDEVQIQYTMDTGDNRDNLKGREVQLAPAKTDSNDEVDAILEDISPSVSAPFQNFEEDSFFTDQDNASDTLLNEQGTNADDRYLEIAIKRGDALEKIARANGTTIEAIKAANHLKTDRLRIGQILRIPTDGLKTNETNKNLAAAPSPVPVSNDPHYYTIKSGDNPWKIAKQFHIKVDDMMKLNDLDEEKARNLKIGDQIRVK
jgi:peptidoglycan DL-endopeptidase LytF